MYFTFNTELELTETNPSPQELHEIFLEGMDAQTKEKRFIVSAENIKEAQNTLVQILIKKELLIEKIRELFPEYLL